ASKRLPSGHSSLGCSFSGHGGSTVTVNYGKRFQNLTLRRSHSPAADQINQSHEQRRADNRPDDRKPHSANRNAQQLRKMKRASQPRAQQRADESERN